MLLHLCLRGRAGQTSKFQNSIKIDENELDSTSQDVELNLNYRNWNEITQFRETHPHHISAPNKMLKMFGQPL